VSPYRNPRRIARELRAQLAASEARQDTLAMRLELIVTILDSRLAEKNQLLRALNDRVEHHQEKITALQRERQTLEAIKQQQTLLDALQRERALQEEAVTRERERQARAEAWKKGQRRKKRRLVRKPGEIIAGPLNGITLALDHTVGA
jgi:predicted Holliday junction resolvase-like endonuclease